jgi:hypothetical protein
MAAVQHTQIWIVSPAAGPKSPMPPDPVWLAVGLRLAAETVRSLEGPIAWLAVAGISALARRAWRPALPAPAPGLSARTRRELPPAGKALPTNTQRVNGRCTAGSAIGCRIRLSNASDPERPRQLAGTT